MAVRKDSSRSNNTPEQKHRGLGCLFWIAFILLIISLYLINKPIIEKNLGTFLDSFKKNFTADTPASAPEAPAEEDTAPDNSAPADTAAPRKPVPEKIETNNPAPHTPAPEAVETNPRTKPAEKPSMPTASTKDTISNTPAQSVKETRERTIWLVRLDADGTLVRNQVRRELPASESPLTDALNALLKGPLPAETNKGLSSLIPPDTELLSVIVRGNTAYVNLSETFQFNTYGIEGYAAQLKQVVWTATEFPTVKDVQILIEGRRVDYLGSEGIFIGSPLSRDSL